MAGWHSDTSQFKGDINKALEQINRDMTGQAPPEETADERLAREAYTAQEEQAREAQEQAQSLRRETERQQRIAAKNEQDADRERKFDQSNYIYGSDGKLYFLDPKTGKSYRKSDYGNQFIPVKNIPAQSERDAMNAAMAAAKAKKRTNSPLPF